MNVLNNQSPFCADDGDIVVVAVLPTHWPDKKRIFVDSGYVSFGIVHKQLNLT